MAYSYSLHNIPLTYCALEKTKPKQQLSVNTVLFFLLSCSLLSTSPWKVSVCLGEPTTEVSQLQRDTLSSSSHSTSKSALLSFGKDESIWHVWFSHIKNSSSSSSARCAGPARGACGGQPGAPCAAALLLLGSRVPSWAGRAALAPARAPGDGGCRRLLRRALGKWLSGQRPLPGFPTASPVSTLVSAPRCRRLSGRGACSLLPACLRSDGASQHGRAAATPGGEQKGLWRSLLACSEARAPPGSDFVLPFRALTSRLLRPALPCFTGRGAGIRSCRIFPLPVLLHCWESPMFVSRVLELFGTC